MSMRKLKKWPLAAVAVLLVVVTTVAGCQAIEVSRAIAKAEANRPRDPISGIRIGAEPFEHDVGPPACLLLHGFQASPQVFRELGQRLADAGISSRAVRLPGHGTTVSDFGKSRGKDWVAAAEGAYDEMCVRYGQGQVFIVGISMGGTVALDLAERRPVPGLVLMAPFLRITRKWFHLVRAESLSRFARSIGFPRVVENLEVDVADTSLRPRLVYVGFTPMDTACSLFDLADRARATLSKVTCPVLVIHGDTDRVADPRESERLLTQLSSTDKRLLKLHRSKHLVPMDYDKEQVFDETVAFVKAHARGAEDRE